MVVGAHANVLLPVNAAVGDGFTVIRLVLVIPSTPLAFLTTNVTVYVPGTSNLVSGFCRLDN